MSYIKIIILYFDKYNVINMKYFLVGFMGSGKSKIGKEISKRNSISFFDLDVIIEEEENKSILKIFEEHGESYFRKLEKKALHKIIRKDNILVATGGGTPCYYNSMDTMNTVGKTIYLSCSEAILYRRIIQKTKKRPLINNLSRKKLKVFIKETLQRRRYFYEKANYIVNSNKENIEEIIKILR